jgi:hypothetical protein
MKAFSLLPWNYRPSLKFLGAPRLNNRMHDYTHHTVPRLGYTWTVARQAWAVRQGFFVQRCATVPYDMGFGVRVYDMERVVMHALDDCWDHPYARYVTGHPDWHKIGWEYAHDSMKTIMRYAREGSPEYGYLLAFITQQDEYGYHGAWDPAVGAWSRTMPWFKTYIAEHKLKPSPYYIERMTQAAKMREIHKIGYVTRHREASNEELATNVRQPSADQRALSAECEDLVARRKQIRGW